ncbi:protein unc-13 homolog D isoform X3 [Boleophthalmus pectinirostris]|uniref:protein unc-13 homolog D isoform X3 n=1 Tax=Boleophthalmus pectinirostris TaxID=150288 RepID=UPI00242FA016|nr:protein unc-13 homolog D isoform X3 [Boleophthalmus pectinirostris]
MGSLPAPSTLPALVNFVLKNHRPSLRNCCCHSPHFGFKTEARMGDGTYRCTENSSKLLLLEVAPCTGNEHFRLVLLLSHSNTALCFPVYCTLEALMAASPNPGRTRLQAPQQGPNAGRHRQSSPGHVRKLGLTRKRDRRDIKEDENPEEKARRHKEFELKPLYKELLYTIAHQLGKASSPEVYSQAQLQQYIQEAFTMTDAEHSSLLQKVQDTESPVYCLMATIKEAKGILGKDVSGFSDPYCLLTVMVDEEQRRSTQAKSKPCKSVVKNANLDGIYQTDIKKQTLNPIWNQTFIMEFADMAGANFHLEMWDKDEEVSLSQKLEEIKTLDSLRRMIKDAKKEKGTDDFLGRISLKLQDLHCTEDCWYNLEPRTETYPDRGQCHLNLKFIHKSRDGTLSAGRSAYINYCGILQQFVQAYISKQQSSAPWKGELCGEAQVLLEQYATQNDLSPFLQDLAKWVAYSKLYQSLEVDSSVLLQQLTSIEYHWHQQELPYQQKQELGDSLHGFLQYGLCLVSKYRDIFHPTPSSTPKLHTLLRILVQICKTQAFQKLNPAQFELQEEVIDAVQSGTEDWFLVKKGLHQPMTKELSEIVSALSRLINEVQEDIKHNKDVYNRVFASAVQVDVFTVVYRKFDSLLAKEVRETMSVMEGQMEQPLAKNLFPVYLSLQKIHKDKAFLQKRGVLELTNFHEEFREALPYWLHQAFSTTQDRVERAVQVDQLQPLQSGAVPIKHSSSAVDLVSCVQPICQLWEQLSWPDPEEAFMLMVKLTEDVCKIVVNYCKILKERVRVLTENSEYGSAINMLCVVVNDLEYLRSVLTRLPSQLNWVGLKERTQHVIGERQFHNTLHSQLQQAQDILNKEIRSALHTLGKRLNTDIETHVRSMSTRKRFPSKSTEDVAAPLMRYLEKELQYMNENLVQENFNSLLTPLWNNSVTILYQVATQTQHQEGLMVYCQRLSYTLQCLEQCFHAEGNGLPLSTLHSVEYKMLKAHLTHNSLSSFQLIEKFFDKKLTDQNVFRGEKYGAVTLRVSYNRSEQKLRVEVLNAVNLLPMDSNGFSDPYVQLCLEPNHIFPEVEPRCTQIKSCDLNPLFEEVFDFMISLEQCRSPGACLVVTVLDHDTLRTDDFEGEAFLGLKNIPNVPRAKEDNEDSENFQPDAEPAQIRLSLMHPKPNEDNILKLLETRKGEREAQMFVKKRRLREKQSQENNQP